MLPEHFNWTHSPVSILQTQFGLDLQLEKNWLEIQAKVGASVWTWLQRQLSLKGRVEMYSVYILPPHPLLNVSTSAQQRLLDDQGLAFLPLVGWMQAKGLKRSLCQAFMSVAGEMPHLMSHQHASRLVFLCHMYWQLVEVVVSDTFCGWFH